MKKQQQKAPKKSKLSLHPKQVAPVARPVTGALSPQEAASQYAIGPSGQVGIAPSRYHMKFSG